MRGGPGLTERLDVIHSRAEVRLSTANGAHNRQLAKLLQPLAAQDLVQSISGPPSDPGETRLPAGPRIRAFVLPQGAQMRPTPKQKGVKPLTF